MKWSIEFLEQPLIRFVALLIACLAVYLFWVSTYLQIDYHDSYFVLLNARCIATGNPLGYTEWRPVILPITLSPVLFLERWVHNSSLIFSWCHATMIAFYVCTLLVFYRFLRTEYRTLVSVCTTFLLAFNPLMVHSAPYCKEDVIGLLLLNASFLFYWKTLDRRFSFHSVVAACVIALAIGVRFNYFVIPLIIGLHYLTRKLIAPQITLNKWLRPEHFKISQIFTFLILPAALFVLLISIHYWRLGLSPFKMAFASYLHNSMFKMAALVKDQGALPAVVNVDFLVKVCGWIIPMVATIGVLTRLRNLNSFLWLNLIWLCTFATLQTFLIQYKEVRFLMPLLPPILIFFIEGALWIQKKWRWFLFVSLLSLIELIPKSYAELRTFRDPVYTKPFAQPIADYASELANDKTIFWVGHFYSLHPENYAFDNRDVTYYIYHLYVNALAFYSKKYRMENLRNPRYLPPERPDAPVFIGPNAGAIAEDGDALVINLENDAYTTSNMPKTLKPLIVERVRKAKFHPKNTTLNIYTSPDMPDASIEAKQSTEGLQITGSQIPDGRYEVYLKAKELNVPIGLQVFDIKDGSFTFKNADASSPINIEEIFLLYFDSVKQFELPR